MSSDLLDKYWVLKSVEVKVQLLVQKMGVNSEDQLVLKIEEHSV